MDIDKRRNYEILGDTAYVNGDYLKAIELYEKSLEYAGDDTETILFNLAMIYDETNQVDCAIDMYNKIIKINPKSAGAYYGVAIMLERKGKIDEALEYYLKAIEIDKYYDRAYYFAANAFDILGDLENAIEYYEKVIELRADDYHAYNNLASIYEELGEYKIAKNLLEKSIGISPFYKSLFNMGVVEERLGNDDRALEYYEESIDYNKHYHFIYLNMSAVYIRHKDYNQAIEILSRGIRYNENAADLYYNRACCHAILGNIEAALKDIDRSLFLNCELLKWYKKDKDFDELRNHIDFIEILNKYEGD